MATDNIENTERVLIVGGGPVGLALALVLARYEIPSLILEERAAPTPRDESRAITWMPRGLELTDWLGLTPALLEVGVVRTAHEFWAKKQLLTLSFDKIKSRYQYTLQLPQHDTEAIFEQAALATGLVEIRRRHEVVGIRPDAERAIVQVASPTRTYTLAAAWGVGCDGAKSAVRRHLGIESHWRDYGTYSAVADFEMKCALPETTSRIVLDPARPFGFFYFAPGRWRMIYRINADEDRQAVTSPTTATALLKSKLPEAKIERFLWASAFRLGQGQSQTYCKDRWILAGDAAHAMGPSAGAGMMVGLMGAWRLGWRLALVVKGQAGADHLLQDYWREQTAASNEVQSANALIFRNLAVTNGVVAGARTGLLSGIGHVPPITERLLQSETLLGQTLPVASVSDSFVQRNWKTLPSLGSWHTGRRLPFVKLADQRTTLDLVGLNHLLIPIGQPDAAERALADQLIRTFNLPISYIEESAEVAASWRVQHTNRVALALVRPDQHIEQIFQLPTAHPG